MRYEIDNTKCKECANCALECPQNAIYFGIEDIFIITEECNQCGDCIKICKNGAIKEIK